MQKYRLKKDLPLANAEWLEEIPEKSKSVWDLKEGDKYFYLSEVGDIRIADTYLTHLRWRKNPNW